MNQTCMDKLIYVLNQMKYDSIPLEIVLKTKECLADFIGIFINGTRKEDAIKLHGAVANKISNDAESIALWMGSTARMLDIDDGHRFAMAHPGVVVNSAAIAMAMTLPTVSGEKIIEALVKGYEVYCYQGRVINPSAYLKRGIDATCVCGAGAAATVAGTMMGLSDKQIADAISLAASVAGGLNQSAIDGSAQKYLVAGFGAKIGIAAANLAKHGMGGPSRVFEGKLGFCNAFSPEPDTELLNNPKLMWDVKYAYIKMYSCVRRIHATLDAVNLIIQKENLSADQIKNVNVYGSQFLYDAGGYNPKDMAQAQTSVPYAVALLLKYKQVSDDLVHENINNQEIARLSQKITVFKDDEIIALAEKDKSLWGAARVEIITNDGKNFTKTKITPDGDPETPLPANAVHNKFVELVKDVTGMEKAEELWQQIESIDRENNTKIIFNRIMASL